MKEVVLFLHMGFFDRFLGGPRAPVPGTRPTLEVISSPRRSDVDVARRDAEELQEVRENNLRKAMDSVFRRRAGQAEHEQIRAQVLKDLRADFFPAMSQEEMRSAVLRAVKALGMNFETIVPISDEYQPMSDSYTRMDTTLSDSYDKRAATWRREIFERTFADELNRVVSRSDIAFARREFESDTDIQSRWSTMFGEQIQAYARRLADTVMQRRAERDEVREVRVANY